jgi:hypothetical protein
MHGTARVIAKQRCRQLGAKISVRQILLCPCRNKSSYFKVAVSVTLYNTTQYSVMLIIIFIIVLYYIEH